MDTKPNTVIPRHEPPRCPTAAHRRGVHGRHPPSRPRPRAIALLLLLIAGCAPRLAAAADAPAPLTLDEALRIATAQAPKIGAAEATIAGAEALVQSAGQLPDPELILGIDNLPIEGRDSFSLGHDFMTMRSIGFMQSLPGTGKRRLRSDRAAREVDLARAQWRRQWFETGRAATQAWIGRARAEAALAELRDLRPVIQLQVQSGRAALASGRASAADALAAATVAARLDERLLALQQETEQAAAELARWVGAEASRPPAPLPSGIDLPAPDAAVTEIADHAPLALAQAEIAAAKADVALARAERRPDWSAELVYSKRGAEFDDMVSLQFRIGLPLFASRRQNPVITARMAAVRAGEAEMDAEFRMHRAEIDTALATWRQGGERLRLYTHELLPLARERRALALAAYGSGRADLRATLDAISAEIDTRIEHIDLQAAVASAWAFLHLLHETEEQP